MNNWVKQLINKLNLDGAFIYLIDDPDGLCYEPQISDLLTSKEATLVDDPDPLALRLSFENWIQQKRTTALVVRLLDDTFVPFDIAQLARKVSFNLADICPEIDSNSLRQIPVHFFQSVIDAINIYRPGKLSPLASADFILRHVYKIAPEVIQTSVDVVRLLIRKHYIGIEMPAFLEQRLVSLLQLNPQLKDWDFAALIPSKSMFFVFLQEQWALFVSSIRVDHYIEMPLFNRVELVVPFDDADIRLLIDNLFADGVLLPLDVDVELLPKGHWAVLGLLKSPRNSEFERCARLFSQLKAVFDSIEEKSINHEFWSEQSHSLGVLHALFYRLSSTEMAADYQALRDGILQLDIVVDVMFERWLVKNFAALQSLPTVNVPVMVHKIPAWLATKVANKKKVCLLVFDGMGARQWPILRNLLQPHASLEEHSCFAWVPTITSISRQALFSGKRPFAFADSLLTTNKEEALWRDFWVNNGLSHQQVLFAKKAEHLSQEAWQNLIHPSALKVAGIVVNFVDDQMHGMKAGMAVLNHVVERLLEQHNIVDKILALLAQGFEVVITADHGSQEATGIGSISDGVKAETRGERVRIYNAEQTQQSTATGSAETVVAWPGPSFGLPQNCFPILAKGSQAFKPKGENIVGHGGMSLHEVVVPLAVITPKPVHYE